MIEADDDLCEKEGIVHVSNTQELSDAVDGKKTIVEEGSYDEYGHIDSFQVPQMAHNED